MERGADVDVVDDRNCTPLMKAVQNNRPDVVRVLLKFGCDVDRAVEYYPRIVDFLRQGIAERSELKETLGRLKSIFS